MPHPEAVVITLSALQKQLLEQIAHRTTNAYRLVRRAQLILLAAEGFSNTAIGQKLDLERTRVRLWRQRWQVAQLCLSAAERTSESTLRQAILEVLSDLTFPAKSEDGPKVQCYN